MDITRNITYMTARIPPVGRAAGEIVLPAGIAADAWGIARTPEMVAHVMHRQGFNVSAEAIARAFSKS